MDKRKILEPGTRLPFSGMECTIESFAGCGSNAMVYLGTYPDQQLKNMRHRVLIKELFPYHPQGEVFRNENNDICWSEGAEDAVELHRLSFNRGNEIHIRLLSEHPGDIDSNINTFPLHHTLYSVLGFSGGRSMDKELETKNASDIPLTVHIRRLLGGLGVLESFHESGFLHLDISPDNILLIGDGKKERVTLIDYNSVHTLNEIREGNCVYYSAKEGYTAPEVLCNRVSDIGYSSDLYALTAVFYRCITGNRLSALQTIRGTVPDISDVQCLAGFPDTVLSMVRKILKKGLAVRNGRRYQNVEEMRLDLDELQDRIDGKGITHWALWETGRAGVQRIIRENPALEYIREEDQIYSIAGDTETGESILLGELAAEIASPGGKNAVLLGGGGTGKTTALLRAAYLQRSKYSGLDPAITYISLYGWKEQEHSYIKNRILENLKFKQETDSMETARHELIRLMSEPMHTQYGERPKLILLLDSLNEANGNIDLLMKEIRELSEMPGVRILLTSRSGISGLSFPKICLRQLEEGEVTAILSSNGILPPEKEELFQLLRTPMMLSMFIKASLDKGKQLLLETQDQLLESYFSAILEKEIRDLAENTEERWKIEAALYYVLPEIAMLIYRGTAASDKNLLPAVEKCYKRLSGRMMIKVFPQWIGHISDIRNNAQNAEEWYGQMIQEILWRKLGLIVRDEQGNYRIAHQIIEEYLIGVERNFDRRFVRMERIRMGIFAAICICMLCGVYQGIYIPYKVSHPIEETRIPYDGMLAQNALDTAFTAYGKAANQYEAVSKLLACLSEDQIDESKYDRYLLQCQKNLETERKMPDNQAMGYIEPLLASGEVMPWSLQPLDTESYEALTETAANRTETYRYYVDILDQARADESLWNFFGKDYLDALKGFIESDAYILGKYYNNVVEPEMSAMSKSNAESDIQNVHLYNKTLAYYTEQNLITENAKGRLETYIQNYKEAERELHANGLADKISTNGGN